MKRLKSVRAIALLLVAALVLPLMPNQKVEAATTYKVDVRKSKLYVGETPLFKPNMSRSEEDKALGKYKDVNALRYTYVNYKKQTVTVDFVCIRDIAKLMSSTGLKFNVAAVRSRRKYYFATKKTYKPTGNELKIIELPFKEKYKKQTAVKSTYGVYVNGKKVNLTLMYYNGRYYADIKKLCALLDLAYTDYTSDLYVGSPTYYVHYINSKKNASAMASKEDLEMKNVNDPKGVLTQPYGATEFKENAYNADDLFNNITYMYTHNETEKTFEFPNMSVTEVNALWKKMNGVSEFASHYFGIWNPDGYDSEPMFCPELTESVFGKPRITVTPSLANIKGATCKITLSVTVKGFETKEQALAKNKEYWEDAYKMAQLVVDEYKITKETSEYDKIQAINVWLTDKFKDMEYRKKHGFGLPKSDLEGFLEKGPARGYWAICEGQAVCGGMASAAAILLRYFGFDHVYTVGSDTLRHAWTEVVSNGEVYQLGGN